MPKITPDEDVERALQLAAAHQSTTAASEAMKALGRPVPRQTIDKWINGKHAERYHRIREEYAPELAKRIAAQLEDQLPQQFRVKGRLYERLETELDELKPDRLASTIKDISVDTAVTIDKINVLRGMPTEIHEHTINLAQIDGAISLLMKQAEEKQKAIDVQSVELDEGEQG